MATEMKWIFKTILLAISAIAIFFAPLFYAHIKYPSSDISTIEPADAALVFGALVRENRISPLHEERLKAAVDLLDRKLISTIVVSNTKHAAQIMAAYLEEMGVLPAKIEIDGTAVKTSDTCRTEQTRNAPRKVIFVSQGFHLPRLSIQCEMHGILGQSLPAERYRASGPNELSRWRIAQIRLMRHTREAALLWTALLGIYDNL